MLVVHEGEALTFLQQIEPETVDCILTDPPYCNGGIKGSDRRRPTSCKIQQSQTIDKKPDFVAPDGAVVISAVQKTNIEQLKQAIYDLI